MYRDQKAGSAIVHVYEKTWRLYSIAIDPQFQNLGLGRRLLDFLIQTAKGNQIGRFTLEADASNANLLSWYQSFGFNIIDHLPHYYGDNEDGYKMELIFTSGGKKTSNLIVTDGHISWVHRLENVGKSRQRKSLSVTRVLLKMIFACLI